MAVELKQVDPQPIAIVGLRGVRDLPAEMGRAFGAVYGSLARRGLAPSGPALTRHFGPPKDGVFDLDVGFPVAQRVADDGDVYGDELPGGKVASTWHVGAYDGLSDAWMRFHGDVSGRGLTMDRGDWKIYWSPPEETDPGKIRTELIAPVG